jgi:hypothetical protein
VRTIEPPWEASRAVIAVLRKKALPSLLEHADRREHAARGAAPGEPTIRLSLTDDVFLRSSNWARWQLGIPVPPA